MSFSLYNAKDLCYNQQMVAHNEAGMRVWTPEEFPKAVTHALELRRKGCSYPKIADALGVSLSTAYRYVNNALERLANERKIEGEKVLDLEIARLDRMCEAIMDKVDDGSLDHIDTMLKLMDRRAKLLGLNAPSKHSHEIDDKRGLPDQELYNRTHALLQRLQAAGHDVSGRLLAFEEVNPFVGALEGQVLEPVKDAAPATYSADYMAKDSATLPSTNNTTSFDANATPSATPSPQNDDEHI